MFLIVAIQCVLFNYARSQSEHPILLVVSYDGFRYDYFKQNITPHLERLKTEGTRSEYLVNVFPTKTFPNHFSIATGLYPEVHGVVGNSFYDPQLEKIVRMGPEMFAQNPRVVPIWRLNEDAGKRRYSGTMMWPGSSYPYQDKMTTYNQDFDRNIDYYKRIDTVISWLTNREKPANLVMLYIEDPDTHSHIYGPDSDTVYNIIKRLDNVTQYLEDELVKHNLAKKVNVIHTSDHGMIGVSPSNFINITTFLSPDTYLIAGSSPTLHIIPKKGYESEVYNRLSKAARSNGHFTVYKKEDLLSRWRYKNNPRIPPIFVLAEKGYGFQDLAEYVDEYKNKYRIPVTPETMFGVHGYDNEMPEMRPFFIAHGPKIKKRHVVQPFSTLDLFGLFSRILEIKEAPNNGTGNANDVLIVKGNSMLSTILITAGGVLLSLLLICIAASVTIMLIKRQQNITTAAALNKRFPQTFHQSIEAQHLLDTEDA